MNRQQRLQKKKNKRQKNKQRSEHRKAEHQKRLLTTCGACKACCFSFPVEEYGKEKNQWCQHVCEAGCAIHSQQRAKVCEDYQCLWLYVNRRHPGCLPIELRPDNCGLILSGVDDGLVLQVTEYRANALETNVARRYLDALKQAGHIIHHPPSDRGWCDLTKYSKAEAQRLVTEARSNMLRERKDALIAAGIEMEAALAIVSEGALVLGQAG